MEQYDYSENMKRKSGRRTQMIIIITLCAIVMMLGSGAVGALLTAHIMGGAIDELQRQQEDTVAIVDTFIGDTGMNLAQLERQQEGTYALIDDLMQTSQETEPTGLVNPERDVLALPELFQDANPAVVAIVTQIQGRNAFGWAVTQPSAGSGFIVSEDGYIVTNHHVIENAIYTSVLLHDGTSHLATLVGGDALSDIAVLKIDAQGLSYLSFADSDELLVGEQIVAIGNPLGEFANSMSAGVVSALDREINIDGTPRIMLQTDAAVNSGNSGGPLIDMTGRVVGVVTAKHAGANVEGLGFAIPSNVAQQVATDLISAGFVRSRPMMGVHIGGVLLDGEPRIIVEHVVSGGGADRAGVQPGDIILTANDESISSFGSLRLILDTFSPGDTMPIQVFRNGDILEFSVILDESPPPA